MALKEPRRFARTITEAEMVSPLLRAWRSHLGLAVLRLRTDVVGSSRIRVRKAGDLIFATWSSGQRPLAQGWLIANIGFICVLKESDVEVLERP